MVCTDRLPARNCAVRRQVWALPQMLGQSFLSRTGTGQVDALGHLCHLGLEEVAHRLRVPGLALTGQQASGGEAGANLLQGEPSRLQLQGVTDNRQLGGVGVEVDAIDGELPAIGRLTPVYSRCWRL
jgi:hypothetical protein